MEDIAGAGCAAPDEGAEAREQLLHVEGLDDIIVRAGVEAAHAVLELVAGGEHEDWGFLGFAQAAQDFPAVHLGQHDIEDDAVVVIILGVEESRFAVGGAVHGVTLLLQGLSQAAEQVRFVFDNENSHWCCGYGKFNTFPPYCHPRTWNIKNRLRKAGEIFGKISFS